MDHEIFFIRHNFTELQRINPVLEQQRRIAIRFNTEEQTTWDLFTEENRKDKAFSIAWKSFIRLAVNGGIVIAQYYPGYCVIGRVSENTPIEFLPELRDQKLYGYKTLKLIETKEVQYHNYPLLMVLKPRQRTISAINKRSHNFIKHVYTGEKLDFSLDNLHYQMQEKMCEEWLRLPYCPETFRMKYPILKTGKDIQAIDICGRTVSGRLMFAQVTYGHQIKKKIKALQDLAKESNDILVLFSQSQPNELRNSQIQHIPLRQVWDDLKQDVTYREMLKDMIGMNQR